MIDGAGGKWWCKKDEEGEETDRVGNEFTREACRGITLLTINMLINNL